MKFQIKNLLIFVLKKKTCNLLAVSSTAVLNTLAAQMPISLGTETRSRTSLDTNVGKTKLQKQ